MNIGKSKPQEYYVLPHFYIFNVYYKDGLSKKA